MIYLSVVCANSDMADCISRLVKLILAEAKCFAQSDLILRYRSIIGSIEQAALALSSLVGISAQFAQVVVIVESAEQTAAGCVQPGQGLSAVGASCSFGWNKYSAGSNLLILNVEVAVP